MTSPNRGVATPRPRALAVLRVIGLLGVFGVLASGCSGSGVLGSRTAASPPPADVQEMQRRLVDLQRKAAVTEVELERLRERVAELEGRAGISRPATERRSVRPASPAPPPPPRGDVTGSPAGRLDDRREITPPRDSSTSRGSVVEIEDISVEEAPRAVEEPARPSRTAPTPAPAPSGGASAGEVTAAAQELYDRGYTLYHQGRFVDAESSFQRFIQSYPDTELTDNAQYWIGESRLARGDNRGALAAFRETVERHPRGNKVPDALLKVGETMAALGDTEGAREAYREVTRRFAGTTAAAVAEDRLAALP